MKFYSHGAGSDLREHLAEVMAAAITPEERIICACHDLGKATAAWQRYIRGEVPDSPHHHAAAGGIFAALLLLELRGPEAEAWALVALHAGAAHHTALQQLGSDFLGDLSLVAADAQARDFVLDSGSGIAALVEVPVEMLQAAWARFVRLAPPVSGERMEFNRTLKKALAPEQRLSTYLRCRSLLGRLCLLDHRSAARQSGKPVVLGDWQSAFPMAEFVPRPVRSFATADSPIARLRTRLQEAFLTEVGQDGTFYFIDAPTGLGKTEAMLRGAELLVRREGFRRIVFAVPQVSVADQIFEDYFAHCRAQIWNFRRREKSQAEANAAADSLPGNGTDAEALEIEQHPFEEPYNVTTFNQVLLAMYHPDRNRCIRGLGLRDAVVILDEFHKLPQVILPFFFRLAREYARQFHCKFILGSATPLEPFAFWDLEDSRRIPADVTRPVYQAAAIDNRRVYRALGPRTVAELALEIEAFQTDSDRNLLVVVNLVGAGSWPLRQHFHREFQPWRQLEELQGSGSGRIMVWLDGLVPPGLRRELVIACREAMKHRPVTLISTQMVEVGVDLDFDAALIDYQGIAATMQRGGRVGRNGRAQPCEVGVFSLSDAMGNSSFERLLSVREKHEMRLKISPFDALYQKEVKFQNLEKSFFRQWGDRLLHDSELAASLADFQRQVFSRLTIDRIYDQFFAINTISGQSVGASFDRAQFVAELFDAEDAEEIVLVESQECYEELCQLNARIKAQRSTPEERRRFLQLLIDRKIAPARTVKPELGLSFCGWLDYPDHLGVFRLDSLVW